MPASSRQGDHAPQFDEDGDLIGPDGYTDANRPDEDTPDLSTPYWLERFANSPVRVGPPTPPGRPPSATRKAQVTLRLDPDILARFRATGPGWQTRINAALRAALPPEAP